MGYSQVQLTWITTVGAVSPPPDPGLLITMLPTLSCLYSSLRLVAKSCRYAITLAQCHIIIPQAQSLHSERQGQVSTFDAETATNCAHLSSHFEGRGIWVRAWKNAQRACGCRPCTTFSGIWRAGGAVATLQRLGLVGCKRGCRYVEESPLLLRWHRLCNGVNLSTDDRKAQRTGLLSRAHTCRPTVSMHLKSKRLDKFTRSR